MKITAKEFFKVVPYTNSKLSPNKKFIVFLKPYLKTQNLWIRDLRTQQERLLTSQQLNNINHFAWKNNRFIIYILKNDLNSENSLFLVDIKKGTIINVVNDLNTRILGFDAINHLTFEDNVKGAKDKFVFYANASERSSYDMFLFDLKTMKYKLHFSFRKNEFVTIENNSYELQLIYNRKIYPQFTFQFMDEIYFINKIDVAGKRTKLLSIPWYIYFRILGRNNKNGYYFLTNKYRKYASIYSADHQLKNEELVACSQSDIDKNVQILNNEIVEYKYPAKNNWFNSSSYLSENFSSIDWEIKENLVNEFYIPQSSFLRIFNYDSSKSFVINETSNLAADRQYLYNAYTNSYEKINTEDLQINEKYLVSPIYYNDSNSFYLYKTNKSKIKNVDSIIIWIDVMPWRSLTLKYNKKIQYLVNHGHNVVIPDFDLNIHDYETNNGLDIEKIKNDITLATKNIINSLKKLSNASETRINFYIANLSGTFYATTLTNIDNIHTIIFDQSISANKDYINSGVSVANLKMTPTSLIEEYVLKSEWTKNVCFIIFEGINNNKIIINKYNESLNMLKKINNNLKSFFFNNENDKIEKQKNLVQQFNKISDLISSKKS